MRRLILHMSVSLDGFVARSNGTIDWLGAGKAHDATRHHANLEMIGQAGRGRGDTRGSRTARWRRSRG